MGYAVKKMKWIHLLGFNPSVIDEEYLEKCQISDTLLMIFCAQVIPISLIVS